MWCEWCVLVTLQLIWDIVRKYNFISIFNFLHLPTPSPPQGPSPSPSPSPPPIPLRRRIKPHQRISPNAVPAAQQLRNIDIQRAVRLGARQQLVHAGHGGGNRVGRGPRALQHVEADLAGAEVDVRMADGRDEADGGRRVGVRRRDVDVEEPGAA